ncbi:unnamed protein product [Blepharisma stoltei]|uniref:Myb-like DNA-binding domain containing protein n=1 Tax=Blepharisma stoltei TaxID=1481888 RepID=A0AAU9IK99_9CILI|nr:unnamed protein product [Blepharisma stoltei]
MEGENNPEESLISPVPCNYIYFPTFFQSLVVPVTQAPFPPVEENKKKYQRTWDKRHIELLYQLSHEFSQNSHKAIEDLKETDLYHIATQLNRSPAHCLSKLREIIATGTLRPGAWSAPEDEIINESVRKNKKWGFIAKEINLRVHKGLKVRTGKQCKERWNNHLDPNVNKGPWSNEEDLQLLELYKAYGNKWSKISQILKTRTENSIKNRLKSLINVKKQELSSLENSNVTIEELIDERKNREVVKKNLSISAGDIQN